MMKLTKVSVAILIAVSIVVSTIIGFLIGYLSATENTVNKYYRTLIQNEDSSFTEKIINEVNADRIGNHLRIMTNKSHMAGTEGDLDSANYVYDTWKSQKLDYVKKIDYEVLLSYPDPKKPNSFEIVQSDGQKKLYDIVEAAYDPELNYSYIPRPFLAYGMNGSYTSDRVYFCNYCRYEDFQFLKKNKNIDFTNSIVLCRYGKIFRGNKVQLAEENGAKAVLIYEDPIRGSPTGQSVYPEGEFLPGDGMQRGTLFIGNGDPLTPIYPSTKDAFRIEESETTLPKIVAQVIGYDYAKVIFAAMDQNEAVEDSWKGDLKVKYTYGGKLNSNQKLTVNVYNERKILKTYNVIGIIKGSTEPDRYVLMGNHRDAWVLGAMDPTSGTATMLEISHVLNDLKRNKGWVPKRTIIFLSWGAEEYGLIGSVEWVEEFQHKLSVNSIAYINVDTAVTGNYSFIAQATPSLFDLVLNVTKLVKFNDEETVYDRWLKYEPNEDKTKPLITSELGSGSDHMSFQQRLGLACIEAYHTHNIREPKYQLLSYSYATYHSSFETFNLVNKYIDPGFKSFKIVATVVSEIIRRLSDSLILPFNFNDYASDLELYLKNFKEEYGDDLDKKGISIKGLEDSIQNFGKASSQFHARLNKIDKTQINVIRQFNDQIKNLEKAFLDPSGYERNEYLHMVSAPSIYNSYGGDSFPALSDAIFKALEEGNDNDWKNVKKQLAILIYVINSASYTLDETLSFEREF